MTREQLEHRVRTGILLETVRREGRRYVPAAVSGRHVHLSRADAQRLFGVGCELTPLRELSQPGQFACAETVTVEGPKGAMRGVRVLGPFRRETQVELSATDAHTAGIRPAVRMSGDLADTPGACLAGPAGAISVPRGVIVAARHLHISPDQAAVYGLADGEMIRLRSTGIRGVVFEGVAVRVDPDFQLELHLDFDEANCAGVRGGDLLEIL